MPCWRRRRPSWRAQSARHRSELRAVLRARARHHSATRTPPDQRPDPLGDTESSIERTADLGAGRRLVRLDRFGRKADYELSAALRGAGALVLDLRHNQGGVLRRMLRIAGRFTGPVPDAVRLVKADQVRVLAIPEPSGAIWRGPITVLVGPNTISSGEVLAALLRRHAGATVLGERTWGKDYVLRVEAVDPDWRALIPDGQIEVPGEILAGGLLPDGRSRRARGARRHILKGRARRTRPRLRRFVVAQSIATGEPIEPVAPRWARAVDVGEHVHAVVGELLERQVLLIDDAVAGLQELVQAERATGSSG